MQIINLRPITMLSPKCVNYFFDINNLLALQILRVKHIIKSNALYQS